MNDDRVASLRMRGVLALLAQWDEQADDDNYSKGDAAEDLRRAMNGRCTCVALPHDRRCPARLAVSR